MHTSGILLILGIISLVISVCSLIGLFYITQMTFDMSPPLSPLNDTLYCSNKMNNTKINFAKFTIVLIWIQFSLLFIKSAVEFYSK